MSCPKQNRINVAVLGTGMMGQEHISYMAGYTQITIKYICDPNPEMAKKASSLIPNDALQSAQIFHEEKELLEHVKDIDLLVIATPNYMHTPQLLRWANHDICILVEKPVAISEKQVRALRAASHLFVAKIWVAMEYRYIPAVQKLYQLLPTIGDIKNVTIRENRFPFLSKVNEWNKDVEKSGDTLVEKCCHFFDLFRLLSKQEMRSCTAKVQRGLLNREYGYDKRMDNPTPIIDSAYVLLDFEKRNTKDNDETKEEEIFVSSSSSTPSFAGQQGTLGCLELCMFADGSRHQEEIVVTGLNGRVEAYLPENKVFHYTRPKISNDNDGTDKGINPPNLEDEFDVNDGNDGNKNDARNEKKKENQYTGEIWKDRSQPPPQTSIMEEVIDCSILSNVYSFADEIPQHAGHHYCSTAVEWKHLIDQVENWQKNGTFTPQVSLDDGIAAVEMGMKAQMNISNVTIQEKKKGFGICPITAFGSQSCDQLLNLALGLAATAAHHKHHVGVPNSSSNTLQQRLSKGFSSADFCESKYDIMEEEELDN